MLSVCMCKDMMIISLLFLISQRRRRKKKTMTTSEDRMVALSLALKTFVREQCAVRVERLEEVLLRKKAVMQYLDLSDTYMAVMMCSGDPSLLREKMVQTLHKMHGFLETTKPIFFTACPICQGLFQMVKTGQQRLSLVCSHGGCAEIGFMSFE